MHMHKTYLESFLLRDKTTNLKTASGEQSKIYLFFLIYDKAYKKYYLMYRHAKIDILLSKKHNPDNNVLSFIEQDA